MNRISANAQVRCALGASIMGLLLACCNVAGEQAPPVAPKADEAVQRILRALSAPVSEGAAEEGLGRLKTMYAGRHRELVQQLFLFAGDSRGTRAGMLPAVVINALEVSERDLALGVSPWLEHTDDKARDRARNWLGHVERKGDTQRLDYATYAEILADPAGHDVGPLIRHMVRVDRGEAGKVLVEVYGEQKAAALLAGPVEP